VIVYRLSFLLLIEDGVQVDHYRPGELFAGGDVPEMNRERQRRADG
jgi:hypothetical protein